MKVFIVLESFQPGDDIEWVDVEVFKTENFAKEYVAKEMKVHVDNLNQYRYCDNIFTRCDKRYEIKEKELCD